MFPHSLDSASLEAFIPIRILLNTKDLGAIAIQPTRPERPVNPGGRLLDLSLALPAGACHARRAGSHADLL